MVLVFRKLNACLGGPEKAPRIAEAGEVHWRKGPPRSGEFRESSPEEAPRSDLTLHFLMGTLHFGSFERTLVVVVGVPVI